jgi:hypothetical protein
MFETNLLNVSLFAILFLSAFYVVMCIYSRRILVPNYRKLLYYVTLFSLFGVVGEVLVNTLYSQFLGTPLWEYRLFPAHHGSISYFFIFVWGSLGFYRYITDLVFYSKKSYSEITMGVIMGVEAVFLELLYNGLYFFFFKNYIFYYLPSNLGILSHFSCLQVLPFYFVVGFFVSTLLQQHSLNGYKRTILVFYWMIILTFVFLV